MLPSVLRPFRSKATEGNDSETPNVGGNMARRNAYTVRPPSPSPDRVIKPQCLKHAARGGRSSPRRRRNPKPRKLIPKPETMADQVSAGGQTTKHEANGEPSPLQVRDSQGRCPSTRHPLRRTPWPTLRSICCCVFPVRALCSLSPSPSPSSLSPQAHAPTSQCGCRAHCAV
jgi:hypothetical protein